MDDIYSIPELSDPRNPDPDKALDILGNQYSLATDDVKKALLGDPRTKKILQGAANKINENPDAAVRHLNRLTHNSNRVPEDLDPSLAGALMDETFAGHEMAYRAIARGQGNTDPDDRNILNALLKTASATSQGQHAAEGLAVVPETAAETKIRTEIQTKIGNNQSESAAFDKLLKDRNVRTLDPETRFALLSQVKNFPNKSVIENLDLLAARTWFRDASPVTNGVSSLENQQRSAKIIAFYSQYGGGDPTIRDNTLHGILASTSNEPRLEWVSIPSETTKSGIVRQPQAFADPNGHYIQLNSDTVPADNNALTGDEPTFMATTALPHEYNHIKNPAQPNGDFRNFTGEARAYLVGQMSADGVSQLDCYNRAFELITPGGGYDDISKTFWNEDFPDSKSMVRVMAEIIGDDPKTATVRTVTRQGLHLSTVKYKTIQALPKNLRPTAATPDDPNNIDNH